MNHPGKDIDAAKRQLPLPEWHQPPEPRESPKPLSLAKSLSLSKSPCVSCVSVPHVSNGQNLSNAELILTFNEWHRLSQPFLDPAKTGMITWQRFSRSFKRFACQQAKAKHSRKRLSTFRHFRFLHCH
jgi:hypothetical protein